MELDLASKRSLVNFDNTKFNNRLAYLINFLSVMIILFCCAQYVVKNWFTVNKIIISGKIIHVTPVQLSYVAHNKLHGTFFTLDIAELKEEFEQLPWVKQVSVKRHFPHTVEVNLVEYQAVARINDDMLLAEDGEVFGGAESSNSLPIFYTAPDEADLAYEKYQQIQTILTKHNDSVEKLWMNNLPIVKFMTNKNILVTICDQDTNTKLQVLDGALDGLNKINPKLSMINLCYKNAVAINEL